MLKFLFLSLFVSSNKFGSTADSAEIHISVNISSLPTGICLPFLQHWKVNSLRIDAQGLGVN